MELDVFLGRIDSQPGEITFSEVISFIDRNYEFTPTAFSNGSVRNERDINNGSCKIFSFGLLNKLNEKQTLTCFGEYYRKDVLENPGGDDHQNVRNFMKTGWDGIKFEGKALREK